jgi:hypothetical protein
LQRVLGTCVVHLVTYDKPSSLFLCAVAGLQYKFNSPFSIATVGQTGKECPVLKRLFFCLKRYLDLKELGGVICLNFVAHIFRLFALDHLCFLQSSLGKGMAGIELWMPAPCAVWTAGSAHSSGKVASHPH